MHACELGLFSIDYTAGVSVSELSLISDYLRMMELA